MEPAENERSPPQYHCQENHNNEGAVPPVQTFSSTPQTPLPLEVIDTHNPMQKDQPDPIDVEMADKTVSSHPSCVLHIAQNTVTNSNSNSINDTNMNDNLNQRQIEESERSLNLKNANSICSAISSVDVNVTEQRQSAIEVFSNPDTNDAKPSHRHRQYQHLESETVTKETEANSREVEMLENVPNVNCFPQDRVSTFLKESSDVLNCQTWSEEGKQTQNSSENPNMVIEAIESLDNLPSVSPVAPNNPVTQHNMVIMQDRRVSQMDGCNANTGRILHPIQTDSHNSSAVQTAVMPTTTHPEFNDIRFVFSKARSVQCVHTISSVFAKNRDDNYLRGCKWSPDGKQLLTNSNDNFLRTFRPLSETENLNPQQEMVPACEIRESGLVYDYTWFPSTSSSRVACTCPGSPIHLWDVASAQVMASYRAFDHCDELTSAYSLSFSPDGAKVYGGYKSCIRIFDAEYSHRNCSTIKTFNSKTKEGQKGIISCFSHGPPSSHVFVAGSYSRHVGVYQSQTNELMCLIQGQQGGVTHVMMSPDGNKFYTGGRKDPEIVCWDLRNLGHILCTFLRDVQTNQRILFDLSESGRFLVSGNHDGCIQLWDTLQAGHEMEGEIIMKPCHTFQAHSDCVNGVSFNPKQPFLATASGQRHFRSFESDSDDSDDSGMSKDSSVKDFSVKIWSIAQEL